MRVPERLGMAAFLHVQQEVDVALAIMAHRLRAMVADMGEAQLLEQSGQRFGIGAGEFDELEAVEADRICACGHGGGLREAWQSARLLPALRGRRKWTIAPLRPPP
jgi:hypothetical protein